MTTKCTCNNCSAHLEFESEHQGEVIKCPQCEMETRLYIPESPVQEKQAFTQPPLPQVAPPKSSAPRRQSQITYAQGVVIILLLAITLLAAVLSNSSPPASPPQWQYTVESVPDKKFSIAVNTLGAMGWELVFARRATTKDGEDAQYEMIFKRQILHPTDRL